MVSSSAVAALGLIGGFTVARWTGRRELDGALFAAAGLGATITGALSDDGNFYAVGMKDPEGNEFDIN